MTMENPTANSCAARVEQRRSKRFPVTIAAEVKWHGPGGVRIIEKAHPVEVNKHGGSGMGVEFAAMNDDDLARIHQLLNELVR